jgi:hypothetical protein
VRKLKAQSSAQADALQRAYAEAASKHNAWLDANGLAGVKKMDRHESR